MRKLFARFKNNESGATAIEYALIAGLIGVGIITAAGALGTDISNAFDDIGEQINTAATPK